MSARHPGSPGHPRKRDQLRVFLARTGFPKLIAAFLAAMLLTAAVLALGYRLTRESGEPASFLTWWRRTFMTISSFPLDGTLTDSTSTLRQLLLGATAVAGLVFTALGPEALAQFKASTDPLECPTRELRLVRKAGGAGPGAVLDIG